MIKCKPNAKFYGGRAMEIVLWTLSFVASVLIFAWNNTFWKLNKVNSTESVMGWWIVSKFVLPIFLGITCYMCCTGRGGMLDQGNTKIHISSMISQ